MSKQDQLVENLAKEWVKITKTKKKFTAQEKQYIYDFAIWMDKFIKGEVEDYEEE